MLFHPNIDTHGNVCIDILRLEWRPVFGLSCIALALLNLLTDLPLPLSSSSPRGEGERARREIAEEALNGEAGELLWRDPQEFIRRASSSSRGD